MNTEPLQLAAERDTARAQVDAVRGWCDLADEQGKDTLHVSTIRAALAAAAAGHR